MGKNTKYKKLWHDRKSKSRNPHKGKRKWEKFYVTKCKSQKNACKPQSLRKGVVTKSNKFLVTAEKA